MLYNNTYLLIKKTKLNLLHILKCFYSFFSALGISRNLASYLALVHRPNSNGKDLINKDLQEQLETEYLNLKGNLTVLELYERIVPKYNTYISIAPIETQFEFSATHLSCFEIQCEFPRLV